MNYISALQKLDYISDLLYYQGALFTLFKHSTGELFIYKWNGVNSANTAHQWVIFCVDKTQLSEYLKCKLPLLELITTAISNSIFPTKYIMTDIYGDLKYDVIIETDDFSTIHKLPTKESLFDPDYSEDDKWKDYLL